MAYDTYKLLHVHQAGALVTAVVDAPPINVITADLFGELAALAIELEADPAALVFVLKSADPDFFLAHFDVALLIAMANAPSAPTGDVNTYHEMCLRFQRMNTITIAQVENLVEPGDIDPAHVHLPGVFVARVVHTGPQEKRIEKRTVSGGTK